MSIFQIAGVASSTTPDASSSTMPEELVSLCMHVCVYVCLSVCVGCILVEDAFDTGLWVLK